MSRVTVLITYPQKKVPESWQAKLERLDQVIYLPFRVLKAVNLTNQSRSELARASDLAISSHFAAQVFGQKLRTINSTAVIHVLSQKLADQLRAAGVQNHIVVSAAENRRSLLASLKLVDPDGLFWLIGDAARKYYDQFPGHKLVIYENTWDAEHQEQACAKLRGQQITEVLVTSPSNYDRYEAVMDQLGADYHSAHYYVLGPGTGQYLAQRGLTVSLPDGRQKVLDQALRQIWQRKEGQQS